ncbi:hypothetical protein [Streptomyces sp. NPDC094149]|uniref:hypothetical protein n=1 Tax=Streptomyces sp. NPDC094149 TaxID=3155079 RepID=UPI00332C4722
MLSAIARRKVSLDQALADDDDPAIAAITAAELLQDVEMADGVNRVARQSFVDTVLATIPVEEYTVDVARAHARLLAHVRRAGSHALLHRGMTDPMHAHHSCRPGPVTADVLERREGRRSGPACRG